jgi:hypothetical protein
MILEVFETDAVVVLVNTESDAIFTFALYVAALPLIIVFVSLIGLLLVCVTSKTDSL